jgi:hypothetical protein
MFVQKIDFLGNGYRALWRPMEKASKRTIAIAVFKQLRHVYRNSRNCEFDTIAERFKLDVSCDTRKYKASNLCKVHNRNGEQYIIDHGDFDYYDVHFQCWGHRMERRLVVGEPSETRCFKPGTQHIENLQWVYCTDTDLSVKYCEQHVCKCSMMKHKEYEGFMEFLLCMQSMARINPNNAGKYFIPRDVHKIIFKSLRMVKWGSHWAHPCEIPKLEKLIPVMKRKNQKHCHAITCVRELYKN